MDRRAPVAVVALAVLLAAGGCTSAALSPPAEPRSSVAAAPGHRSGSHRYVALGDSYTAGPLIPTTDLAAGCLRSDHDYPHLLAARLHLRLVDVSCSGATTGDLTGAQRVFRQSTVPPQLDAVTPDTDLVTLGIGGNDFGLFGTLIGSCARGLTRCALRGGAGVIAHLPAIGARVTRAVREVRAKAPHARIVLVGYLRIVPDRGDCPALGLSAAGESVARRVSRLLALTLEASAKTTGVGYVDAYRLSRGHDVCAPQPWVNGRRTRRTVAAAYHPLEAGMRAVTRALAARLTWDHRSS